MKSILYLNNRYCTSINDITSVLSNIDNLESPLFHELRRAFQDGTLSAWLSEGSQYEKELATKLEQMPPCVTNEIMLRQFNILFADKDIDIQKPSYKEYFSLQSSRYKFSKNTDSAYSNVSSNIYMSVREGEIILDLNFEILKTANLDYIISIELQNDKREVLHKEANVLSLRAIGKTYTCRSSFDISNIINDGVLVVFVDGIKIRTFNLLSRPVPTFSQDCTGQQKKVIKNLIKQMRFFADTTGTYRIFNGEKYNATLTGYYMSPLIKDGEVKTIMGSYSSYPESLNSSKMDYIGYFIDELNRLSSLKFSLPSEAQWENAAMLGNIEFGNPEWMQDKWDPSATIDTTINPVCTKKYSSHYVVRCKVKDATINDRGCDHGGNYNYFRLVLMIS